MEKREKDRRQDADSDRREEFSYLNVPGLDRLSLGDRRRIDRRKQDQRPLLESQNRSI